MYLALALPALLGLLIAFSCLNPRGRQALGYSLFFITPILTATGALGVLTGFSGAGANSLLFGVSFYSVFVAYIFIKHCDGPAPPWKSFLATTLNPFYLSTGPFPSRLMDTKAWPTLSEAAKRLWSGNREIFTGAFFALILANSLTHFFYLKDSRNVVDILVFGLMFELYVYFNFSGYSMIARAFSRALGVEMPSNFAHPFGASSVVEYWQRWHISLSAILREAFFRPLKSKLGVFPAVFAVFLASAVWHGVSSNFLLWGAFHATFWCVAYRLHKSGLHSLNLLLLPFVVIIGRLIFAEGNWTVLTEKLAVVFDLRQWTLANSVTLPSGTRDTMNLTIALSIVVAEVAVRGSRSELPYGYLARPTVQALIALYICLMFAGLHGEPIYGNR